MNDSWTCVNCKEVLDGQFDACWQCGCSRDKKLNLTFSTEQGNDTEQTGELEREFEASFVCARCKGRQARIERLAARGVGFAQLQRKDLLAVTCENCGLIEFYSLSVLEGRTELGNFLRGLFGM